MPYHFLGPSRTASENVEKVSEFLKASLWENLEGSFQKLEFPLRLQHYLQLFATEVEMSFLKKKMSSKNYAFRGRTFKV